eukprot:jgi/Mesen1/9553/ME000640S08909
MQDRGSIVDPDLDGVRHELDAALLYGPNSTFASRRAARLARRQAAREAAKGAGAKVLEDLHLKEHPGGDADGTDGTAGAKSAEEEEREQATESGTPEGEEGGAEAGAAADAEGAEEGAAGQAGEGAADAGESAAENGEGEAGGESGKFAKGVRPILHESRPLADVLKGDIWQKPAAGTPMPAKKEFALRRDMVQHRSQGNTIVVTFANHAFMDFVVNWVRHLTDVGVTNILVGAMDEKILEGLFYEGVPVFDMESHMTAVDVGWGTPVFHAMGREKVTLINVFLSMGFEILMCDTDMVWLQVDEVIRTVDDDGLEKFERAQAAYNIGILHFRATALARAVAHDWAELLVTDDKIWDQNGFNDVCRKRVGPAVPDGKGVFFAFNGTLKMAILPVSIFCSGHTYFVQFAGTEGKRHRFREAQLFYDTPAYYNPPSGGKHSVDSHFALVNYQLVRVRNALAIATLLNRTLVLPEMWCRFDRIWYPHPGILPGTDMKQPFLCPADHVFEEFGPHIPFREYSFLDNPRTPEAVTQSKLKVKICKRGANGPFADVRLLEFSTMSDAFGGWDDQEREKRFSTRIKRYLGLWCCVNAHPGHIWYDFYADTKPGWKPKPPKGPAEDHPPW